MDSSAILIPKGLSGGIIESQVMPIYKYGIKNGVDIDLISFGRFRGRSLVNVKNAKSALLNKKYGIVYIRSWLDFVYAYFLKVVFSKDYKILYDFRGIVHEESFYRNNSRIKYYLIRYFEKLSYKKADIVMAINKFLANSLTNKFGEQEILIYPVCVEKKISTSEKNRTGAVYLGGTQKWQRIDMVIRTMEKLKNKGCDRFLFITRDSKTIRQKLETSSLNKKEVSIKSLPQDKVHQELHKFKYGILYRDDVLMNNVSMPVKFLEYLNAGIIPIVNNNVYEINSLLEDFNIGINAGKPEIKNATIAFENIEEVVDEYSWQKNVENHPLFNYDN